VEVQVVRIDDSGAGRLGNGARQRGFGVRELKDRWCRRLQRLNQGDYDGLVRLEKPGLFVAQSGYRHVGDGSRRDVFGRGDELLEVGLFIRLGRSLVPLQGSPTREIIVVGVCGRKGRSEYDERGKAEEPTNARHGGFGRE
jgi:hypothetical protein